MRISDWSSDVCSSDLSDFGEVVKEAIDDADLVQQCRHSPASCHFLQPGLEHLPVHRRMPAGNIFEGAKEPAIGRYASRPELRFYQEGVDDGAIGIVPGAHDSKIGRAHVGTPVTKAQHVYR